MDKKIEKNEIYGKPCARRIGYEWYAAIMPSSEYGIAALKQPTGWEVSGTCQLNADGVNHLLQLMDRADSITAQARKLNFGKTAGTIYCEPVFFGNQGECDL